ncbi:hypothetical protein Zmor_020810 [Zophobas morio]|uniref:TM2 domain-containing protein n=1 Tax=Zophobas morio TaxID=2755281 RepID=A0AA38I1U1_9CUCU|nr:hypothetical protein Zmor_020810 [Zophobas morio]
MQCLHVNIRQATFIVLSIIINNINIIQMADKPEKDVNSSNEGTRTSTALPAFEIDERCRADDVKCKDLHPQCLKCDFNMSCIYGELITTKCETIDPKINCSGDKTFTKTLICRYCYQTEPWEHTCFLRADCNSVASPRVYYPTNCTVRDDLLCLGNRTFTKNVMCNWTGGYRWTTALILSITLGGFGADRFYLGHWQEGIGKLFSFGGLGVWTIIDVILISLHYLGPADGSLYI